MSKTILKVFYILLGVAAYGYMLYQLWQYEGYMTMLERLRTAGTPAYVSMGICLLLVPLNILLEAMKWRGLMQGVEQMNILQAQRQVYVGCVAAFLTPYRVGDYPTRALMLRDKSKWWQAILMGIVGSFLLSLVIAMCGLLGLLSNLRRYDVQWLPFAIGITGALLLIVLLLPWASKRLNGHEWKNKKWGDFIAQLAGMSYVQYLQLLGLSFGRYIVFSTQLILVLYFVGIRMSAVEWLQSVAVYYLLVTFSPNIPMADPGIRGSWAIFVWGSVNPQWVAPVGLAVVLLWAVNTLVPVVVGTILKKNA